MGIDNRNQFDMIRAMPKGIAQMIEDFHNNDVKVLLPYNPWDQGTRDEGKKEFKKKLRIVNNFY